MARGTLKKENKIHLGTLPHSSAEVPKKRSGTSPFFKRKRGEENPVRIKTKKKKKKQTVAKRLKFARIKKTSKI